jgi:general secretion pathway protein J
MLRTKRNHGFTLIEILVAMAIFAALSLSAYQILGQAQLTDEVTAKTNRRLVELEKAFTLLDADFRQVVGRQMRFNGEAASEQLMLWQRNVLSSSSMSLIFSRLGWGNYQFREPRGEIVKVGLTLDDQCLQRWFWVSPDSTSAEQPTKRCILNNVERWDVQFYTQNSWSEQWEQTGTLPSGIKLTLQLKDIGKIERVFALPASQIEVLSGDSEE